MTIFHVLEKELKWRREQDKAVGFEGLTKFRPLVAVGAQEPLHDRVENADYFRMFSPCALRHVLFVTASQMVSTGLVASILL